MGIPMSTSCPPPSFFTLLEDHRPPKIKDAAWARLLGIKRQHYYYMKLRHDAGRKVTPSDEIKNKCARALGIPAKELEPEVQAS